MKPSDKLKKEKIIGSERATVSGNKTAINRENREWLKFRKQCSWLYRYHTNKEIMSLSRFIFRAGYDHAILNEQNNKP